MWNGSPHKIFRSSASACRYANVFASAATEESDTETTRRKIALSFRFAPLSFFFSFGYLSREVFSFHLRLLSFSSLYGRDIYASFLSYAERKEETTIRNHNKEPTRSLLLADRNRVLFKLIWNDANLNDKRHKITDSIAYDFLFSLSLSRSFWPNLDVFMLRNCLH